MKRMNRSATLFAAVSTLGLMAASAAEAQSIGGFPIREPGSNSSSSSASKPAPDNQRNEVVVSQATDSKVTTIAEAMRLVKPGGTILVKGGTYAENIKVTKPVAIQGMPDEYGRNAVIRPAATAPCVSIAPDSLLASVSISQVIFEFDQTRAAGPCVDIRGDTVSIRDSYIIPADSSIPLRASFGRDMRPELLEHIARPPRDQGPEAAQRQRVEKYFARHAQPVGADNPGWDYLTGGTAVEEMAHAQTIVGSGLLTGPSAGVRVTAGDVRLDGNVIVGARTAIEFASFDRARIQGEAANNIILGNGVGIAAAGVIGDLKITRNTIRYNRDAGVRADMYYGLFVLANEIMGNDSGIELSANVRLATLNSNFVVQNKGDRLKALTGFFGSVSGNTFADNAGCTVQFFSAEQKLLNNVDVKAIAYEKFTPSVRFEPTNYTVDNREDKKLSKREMKRLKKETGLESPVLPACAGALE